MKHLELTGMITAVALAGLLPACASPPATPPAAPPTANAAPATAAPAAPAPAASSSAAPAASSAPAAGASAAAAKSAAPAKPGAASGTISGKVTASPAKLGRHVVVWLDSGGLPAKAASIEIDQRNMKFLPYLAAIPAGGRVIFRNSDPFPHNVFSPDAKKFNLGMMPSHSARSHVFKTVGPHTLLCQIHPGMISYIYVVPSKYYAVTGSNGSYTLKNVPNGTYKISAWAPKLATSTKTVSVAGAAVTVALHLRRGG